MRTTASAPFSFWMGPTSEGLMTKQTRQPSRDERATKKLKLNSDNSCFSPLGSAGELAIQLRLIGSLTPHRRNARTHSRKQIGAPSSDCSGRGLRWKPRSLSFDINSTRCGANLPSDWPSATLTAWCLRGSIVWLLDQNPWDRRANGDCPCGGGGPPGGS